MSGLFSYKRISKLAMAIVFAFSLPKSSSAQIDCYPLQDAAFVRSLVGHPWDGFGVNTFANINNLNDIWGVGQWSDLRYETLNVNDLLANHGVIYLEGGDDNADEMENFLVANIGALEDWVEAGGRLLLNAAPNEGNGMNFGFGGVTLQYDGGNTLNPDAIPVDLSHPVYTGIVANYFDGNYMGHSIIADNGVALVDILRSADNVNEIMLAELDYGAGKVLFGGLTLPWFEMQDWGPQTDLQELGYNILLYLAQGDISCPPDCNGDPGGEAYIDDCGICVEGLTGLLPCALGCTDPGACNFDPLADTDNGLCAYEFDCLGVCGGNAFLDLCGNCYDPDEFGDTLTYFYTGSVQTFVVPEMVDTVTFTLYGAQGGKSGNCAGGEGLDDDGGLGGRTIGSLAVTPGATYYIYVGGQGQPNGSGGWNGGGAGGQYGGGGGGASDVRTTIGFLGTRLLVSGGGGGGQTGCNINYGGGGNGGGLTGSAGISLLGNAAGQGGTQFSGGSGGNAPSYSGSFGVGGGVLGTHRSGGGGGWYGGGSAYQSGAGGGSGYIGGAGIFNASTTGGINSGNGRVEITFLYDIPVCAEDCNGDLYGEAYFDECGTCVEGLTGLLPCVLGCIDTSACNFNPLADTNDGSCEYLSCSGCTDPDACNFNVDALIDDESCEYLSCAGCTNPDADNYDPTATIDDGSCIGAGCMDPAADNYNPAATYDDGSCIYLGCTYPNAVNFDPGATLEDGSCTFDTCNGGGCGPGTYWDTELSLCMPIPPTCPEDFDGDGLVNTSDLLIMLQVFGVYCD
jgi:hypothetical protein